MNRLGAAMAILLVSLTGPFFLPAQNSPQMRAPSQGYVPDEQTAIRICEAVLTPIFGAEKVIMERPFHAILKGDIWTVEGTVHTPNGGSAEVRLRRSDGRILSVTHGK